MLQIKTQGRVRQEASAYAETLDVHFTRVLAAVAEGDLSRRLDLHALPAPLRAGADSVNKLLKSVQALREDMLRMHAEHARGDIDVVIDPQRHAGELREMAVGVNELVNAHIAVKKLAMGVVAEFGKGNFEAPLAQLPGKKAFINDTVEKVRGNLKGLIAEMNRMSAEHEKGDIDVVIDTTRFDGDFRTMATGVNDMVNAHIAVKKLAMGVVAEFGKGNFEAPMPQLPGK
ncbi:MAG TPA: hypothetical protein VGD46_01285, partial [Rhizobacter sp.]